MLYAPVDRPLTITVRPESPFPRPESPSPRPENPSPRRESPFPGRGVPCQVTFSPVGRHPGGRSAPHPHLTAARPGESMGFRGWALGVGVRGRSGVGEALGLKFCSTMRYLSCANTEGIKEFHSWLLYL